MLENDVYISTMLNGRFDFAINRYNQSMNHFLFPTVKLSDLLRTKPQYGANESGIERKSSFEPRYIRITDINEFGVLNSSIGVTAANIEEKYILEDNDILIARSGATVGKSYIYKKDKQNYICFFAGYMIRFRTNIELILPDYLFIYTQLSFYKQWTTAIQRSTGQPNINAEEYQSLKIPLPPKEIQQQVVDLYQHAVEEKQNKEQKSEALLAGINDYLLKELGIVLPVNVEKERYFEVSIFDLIGERLDAYYNQKYFTETIHAINKSKYNVDFLGHLISDLKNGVEIRNYTENGFRYLRVTDLGENGMNDYSPRFVEVQKIPEYIKLNERCILISRSGSLGLVNAFEPKLVNTILSSHIFKVELLTEIINPFYLEAYLRSKIGQLEIFRNNNGGVIPEINQGALRSIHIVIPPIEKQNEIAEHIQSIRVKAKRLQEEAKNVLEKAKIEIEKMIIEG